MMVQESISPGFKERCAYLKGPCLVLPVAAIFWAALSTSFAIQNIWSRREAGFGVQFAKAVQLTHAENPHRAYCYVSLRWSVPLERLGWLPAHERMRLLLEPNGGYFHTPEHGFITGLNVMLRSHFWRSGRFLPFFGLGGGTLYTSFHQLDSKLNFTLLAGLGWDFFLTDRLALQFEYRLHHISNGGIRKPNVGINSNFGSLGLSWYY